MHGVGIRAARPLSGSAIPGAEGATAVADARHAAPCKPAPAHRRFPMFAAPPGAGFLAVLRSIGLPTGAFDAITIGHSERVAAYATEVATAVGLGRAEVHMVRLGAYLHDVGKLRVPREILRKPGRLTDEEFAVVRNHPVWGLELLEGAPLPAEVRCTVRWHHEKADGSGYPDGLWGDAIPLQASIVGIADVYDALTSSRSYRPAMTSAGALALMRSRRAWWRPEVYAAFGRAVASTAHGAARLVADAEVAERAAAGVPAAVA